ncbi:head maturation protease, ClpP-related [Clostridium ihumii]|uniref:head maturation protease, ClpP-related n=1 Tax=Clostridium ihumii TaxID=1470356 RepID=UPI00058B8FFE|nr:head maturation protease, ClpP-related [Clostridium ihumii]
MNRQLWTIKQQADTLEIYLYDDIEDDREDWWTGEKIESETSSKHIKDVLQNNENVNFINVFINSYGGNVKEGLGIYNLLKRHKAYKTAYIDGFACSIASVIPMSCDKIIMGTNALMMIHHASMGCYGNAEQLRKNANDLDVIDEASCSSYLTRAGEKLNEDTLKELLDNQTWLNAKQCVEYGLADEIAGLQEDETIKVAKQKYNKYIQRLQDEPAPIVPKEFIEQKTNANKLMQIFKKKEGK